jgi:GNAT superfamily N-acetyltransferase
MKLRRVALQKWRDVLVDLHKQCFPSDHEPDWGRGDWWLVFDPAGVPVAFAGGYRSVTGWYYLCRAGVLPRARGKGLQRRLIHARLRQGRKLGLPYAFTYTVFDNLESSNNLIRTGFRLYTPRWRWGGKRSLYWRRPLG